MNNDKFSKKYPQYNLRVDKEVFDSVHKISDEFKNMHRVSKPAHVVVRETFEKAGVL